MIRPTVGRVTSPYGFREHPIRENMDFHPGVDYGNINGSKDSILAIADGIVRYKQNDSDGYGYYLVIDHGSFCSLYAHLKTRFVNVGDKVLEGDKIALKGTSGSSTGVHLHFEIRECIYRKFWQRYYNGEWKYAVDPEKFYLASQEYGVKPKDTPDDYAVESWRLMFELGLLDGTRPKSPVLRQELGEILSRIRIGGNYGKTKRNVE